jgi:class 3 adenylate cyclase
MDPEDLREVISAYQKCVAETVRRFGGFVAKYMGDGVLVYFGYPQAHEDDAERAVRAGLELIAAVNALKAPVSLQTRVGIATGLAVRRVSEEVIRHIHCIYPVHSMLRCKPISWLWS